jgi:cytoplasmic iron level regulating protein YaaA (DUF328/UPF0246 family)
LRSGSFRSLGPARGEVAEALARAAQGRGAAKLFGVGGDALARAIAVGTNVVGSPTLPAHERYTGVVWQHLGPATLTRAARTRAESGVVVVSGLLGLVGFDDPVPDYRCKMGASLAPLGKLSRWWRPRLTDLLATRVAGATVLDLLPQEHAEALDRSVLADAARRYLRVELTDPGGRAAGHGAKAAKGLVARAVLGGAAARAEATLEAFRIEPGTPTGAWRFAGADRAGGPDGAVTTVRIGAHKGP